MTANSAAAIADHYDDAVEHYAKSTDRNDCNHHQSRADYCHSQAVAADSEQKKKKKTDTDTERHIIGRYFSANWPPRRSAAGPEMECR